MVNHSWKLPSYHVQPVINPAYLAALSSASEQMFCVALESPGERDQEREIREKGNLKSSALQM